MELENQPFDVMRCIEDAMDLVSPSAAAKGIETAYVIEGELPWCFRGRHRSECVKSSSTC